ncbi:hypothetical protein A5717_19950 [Mycolicibacterium porcinum]|uniref:hypothetical protein n=1 Tax=Mycolicibacterium porcinum TaxID=39693 RepID=UPI00080B1483|nr:hypothetical protein [Mycolicibacterium porcinum]OCB11460.1 hypothetical protein A5717_19950 [Mycolicibacterium porcinum]
MQLAARSYLAAGVALVGASAIAVSPMAPAVPEVHVPVALTASVDNPLTVFEPVATATQTLISNIIERQTTNPAPIAKQLVENAIAGYQVAMTTPPVWQIAKVLADAVIAAQNFGPNLAALGETTPAALTAIIDGLGELGAGLPAALQAAGAQLAAGDPSAAINAIVLPGLQPIIDVLVYGVSPELDAVGKLLNVPQPIVDATFNAILGGGLGLAMATVGIGYDLPGPQPLVKQLLIGAQSVVNAATSGDPIAVVNALQHSTADLISTTIGQVDSTISMANSLADTFADALKQIKPKPYDPPIELPTAKALAASVPAAIEVSTLQAEKPASTPVTNADNASGTATDSADAPSTDASDAGASDADTKVVTKASTKQSPKAATGQAKVNSAKTVRDQVKSTVKKLTDGLKKDKPSTPKKAESSSDSTKGADSK